MKINQFNKNSTNNFEKDFFMFDFNNNKIQNFKKSVTLFLQQDFLSIDSSSKKFLSIRFYDLYQSLSSIKEFINNIKKIKSDPNGKIYVYLKDPSLYLKASFIIESLSSKNKIILIKSQPQIYTIKKLDSLNLIIVAGEFDTKFFSDLALSGFFFITVINKKLIQPCGGVYHIYSDIATMNKIVFLFILIDVILADSVFLEK